MKGKKILAIVLVCVVLVTTLIGCASKKYPSENINVVIPYSAGGPTDMSVRGILEFAQLPKGVSFVPTNKTGANGIVGFTETANSKKDGYNIGVVSVDLLMQHYQGNTALTLKDYIPLAATIADPYGLVVKSDAPFKTVQEFVAYAKANPGKVKIGNSGAGGAPDLAAKAVTDHFKIDAVHVPYNGSADCIAALAGGHIDATFTQVSPAKTQMDAGALVMLAILGDKRMDAFPNVPTFKESTDITFAMRGWVCVVAPAGVSQEQVDYLRDILKKSVATKEYKEYIKKLGLQPVEIVGADLEKMLTEDDAFYKNLLAKK